MPSPAGRGPDRRTSRPRLRTIAFALAGLALANGVIVWLGAGHVLQSIARIGARGLVYVVAWQLAVYVVLGLAWWAVCPGIAPWTLVWARLVREGGQNCLPFSEVGGLVFGARALVLRGVRLALAAASSIVDVVAEGIALAPFLLFGLVVLLHRHAGSGLAIAMAAGLGLLLAGGAAAWFVRDRIARLLRRGMERLLRHWTNDAPEQGKAMEETLSDLLGHRGRLAVSSLVHVVSWCGGGGNVWIAYHLLGAKPGILAAVAIESILSGVLAIGFLIPAALGVQELTYVGVGRLFGIPAPLSLALSLIRRARDIVIGAPNLILWQVLEARQLRRERSAQRPGDEARA